MLAVAAGHEVVLAELAEVEKAVFNLMEFQVQITLAVVAVVDF
jgi:hypothetical protein